MAVDVSGLVDAERGFVDPLVYTSRELYERELERVFGRCWLFLAHESQLRRAGDFVSTYMGADPVLLVRQRDGSLAAFLNACRHRGMRVSREDAGNARAFTCPYHGWAYDLAGRLASVPHEYAYEGVLDRQACSLVQVAQLDVYRGLVFATFDPQAPPLEEYLGDMRYYLDAVFDRRSGGIEVLGGVTKWRIACNWKMAGEQFAGDMYHGYTSHLSPAVVMGEQLGGGDAGAVDLTAPIRSGGQFRSPYGHGSGWLLTDDPESWSQTTLPPDIAAYLREVRAEVAERLDERRAQMESHSTVFPNFSYLSPECPTMRVWHPKGPGVMEVWSWTYVDAAAPAAVKDALRRLVALTFSASGMYEQDDGDNWATIQENLTSPQVRRHPLSFQLGPGDGGPHDAYPGTIGPLIGEGASRTFFGWWRDLMESERWPEPSFCPQPVAAQGDA